MLTDSIQAGGTLCSRTRFFWEVFNSPEQYALNPSVLGRSARLLFERAKAHPGVLGFISILIADEELSLGIHR